MLTFLLLLSTTTSIGCEFQVGDNPITAPVIVTVTLVEYDEATFTDLPHFGSSSYAKLAVAASVTTIESGEFPVAPGGRFSFAVHSVANTFGYDHVGETYQLGFAPREDLKDYDLVGIRVAPGGVRYLKLRILENQASEPASYVPVWSQPQLFAKAGILAADPDSAPFTRGQQVWLGLPQVGKSASPGTVLCLSLKVRAGRPEAERFRWWQGGVQSREGAAP